MQDPIRRRGRPKKEAKEEVQETEKEQEEINQEEPTEETTPEQVPQEIPPQQQVPQAPQLSREDFIERYQNDGEFRYALLEITNNYNNNHLALIAQSNKLIEDQNELLDYRNELLEEQNEMLKAE